MPLKTTGEIYNFYETCGKEFIGIVPNESYFCVRRLKFYHPFLHNRFYRNSKPLKALVRLLEYGQYICGVNRLKGKLWNKSWKIVDGIPWFSVTNRFCEYVLQQEDVIRKHFSSVIAADEIFIQTLAYNSEFVNEIYDINNMFLSSMHYIVNTGKPYVWGQDSGDFEKLMKSPYMFARKFDEQHFEIVEKIYNELNQRNKAEKSSDFEAKK